MYPANIAVYIGCPCNTISGKYILNFEVENDLYIKPLPLEILVKNFQVNFIKYTISNKRFQDKYIQFVQLLNF